MHKEPARKTRGRPIGSAPNAAVDDEVLSAAALHIAMRRCADVANAVRLILGDRATPTVMRRLHRRWAKNHARYEQTASETVRTMRADIDWWALKTNQPELARRIHTFAGSAKGKAMLTERGADPSMPMQLGIYTLFELIEATDPKGASQAERFFDRAVRDWTATGVEPDVAFLRRFAERVQQLAVEIEGRGPSDLDPERPFVEADSEKEGSR